MQGQHLRIVEDELSWWIFNSMKLLLVALSTNVVCVNYVQVVIYARLHQLTLRAVSEQGANVLFHFHAETSHSRQNLIFCTFTFYVQASALTDFEWK